MANIPLDVRHKQKYDTSTNWMYVNPILLSGEIGIESDTNRMKIGNGASNWSALPYTISGYFQKEILTYNGVDSVFALQYSPSMIINVSIIQSSGLTVERLLNPKISYSVAENTLIINNSLAVNDMVEIVYVI